MDSPTACTCVTLDPNALRGVVDERARESGFFTRELDSHEHLYAPITVFVPPPAMQAMVDVVAAVERAALAPSYVERALERAPSIARRDYGTHGAFMGYDFHLDTDDIPRLIEVNTNAGGAYLAAAGATAHRLCCGGPAPLDFEREVLAMFRSEWCAQRGEQRLRRVAIVDARPREQYLYPEFELARRLFVAHGIDAVVLDPSELSHHGERLWARGEPIDLVYSRLTDFYLEEAEHRPLREAYEAGHVVVTPGPRHHALYADKRNLSVLTDAELTASWDLPPEVRRALSTIPRTREVNRDAAVELHAERKTLFFKPFGGHGSKGVYRGAKVTRSVWANIAGGGYVAQDAVPPSERMVLVDGERATRKVDLRLYTYRGATLLAAARVYQGQTTNFRTPGGGFAPLLVAGGCGCGG